MISKYLAPISRPYYINLKFIDKNIKLDKPTFIQLFEIYRQFKEQLLNKGYYEQAVYFLYKIKD